MKEDKEQGEEGKQTGVKNGKKQSGQGIKN